MKKILIVLITLFIVFSFASCSDAAQKKITVHVPDEDLNAKASEWQNKLVWIITPGKNDKVVPYGQDSSYSEGIIYSSKKKSTAVVKYYEGETYYDLMSRIFVIETARLDDWEKNEKFTFVPILVYMTRYGIGDLPFSTTGFLQDVQYDWNQPVAATDLYICFTENTN